MIAFEDRTGGAGGSKTRTASDPETLKTRATMIEIHHSVS